MQNLQDQKPSRDTFLLLFFSEPTIVFKPFQTDPNLLLVSSVSSFSSYFNLALFISLLISLLSRFTSVRLPSRNALLFLLSRFFQSPRQPWLAVRKYVNGLFLGSHFLQKKSHNYSQRQSAPSECRCNNMSQSVPSKQLCKLRVESSVRLLIRLVMIFLPPEGRAIPWDELHTVVIGFIVSGWASDILVEVLVSFFQRTVVEVTKHKNRCIMRYGLQLLGHLKDGLQGFLLISSGMNIHNDDKYLGEFSG